jgi:hypothetical protein
VNAAGRNAVLPVNIFDKLRLCSVLLEHDLFRKPLFGIMLEAAVKSDFVAGQGAVYL